MSHIGANAHLNVRDRVISKCKGGSPWRGLPLPAEMAPTDGWRVRPGLPLGGDALPPPPRVRGVEVAGEEP